MALPDSGNFDCIILAAGLSSRMDKWKMLLPWGTSTIIERCIENAAAACRRIILVTGYRGKEIEILFQNRKQIITIENPDYPSGMFSSVKRGVSLVETEHFFISLGDMPFIDASVYLSIAKKACSKVLFPTLEGERGHPVLLPKTLIPRILKTNTSPAMKEFLKGYPSMDVPFGSDSILRDIDTQTDYRQYLKRGLY